MGAKVSKEVGKVKMVISSTNNNTNHPFNFYNQSINKKKVDISINPFKPVAGSRIELPTSGL